jgi:hypothetical protein
VPPSGAGVVRVTVPVAGAEPRTLDGLTETEAKVGRAVTVIVVVAAVPLRNAVIVSATLVAV